MPFPRPLGMSTKKDAAAGAPFQPTPVRASNPNNNDQRQGIIMAMVSCLWCYISLFFHGRVWYTRPSSTNRNLWRIKLMNNKRIIIGVTIGIIAAILWSVVFINVLNSMAGIGIGICLGISFGISGSLIFSKKDKDI